MNPKILKKEDINKINKILVEFYHNKTDDYGLLERPQEVYEKYANFIWNIEPNRNSRILDLGSGSWRIPDSIAKYGYNEVFGLDFFSDSQLEINTKKLTSPNAKLVKYTNKKIPFGNESFDVVSSLCVMEHILFVEEFLNEIDRVLKWNGKAIFLCPNWSGINAYINGFFHILFKKDRFWHLESTSDALIGIFRSIYWYLLNLFSSKPRFIMVYPRMKNGLIKFERSDDDVVHLCQPLSLKKFFKRKGYKVIFYNRGFGTTPYTYFFNYLLPSLASTNVLVFQKVHRC